MVEITPRAAEVLRAILEQNTDKSYRLRLEINSETPENFSYRMLLDDERTPDDELFDSQGIPLVIDPASFVYLKGSVIDYINDDQYQGFMIHNPNQRHECGCGRFGYASATQESGCGCGDHESQEPTYGARECGCGDYETHEQSSSCGCGDPNCGCMEN